MARVIKQIAMDATDSACYLYALADDGTVWVIQPGVEAEWLPAKLPPLPESEADDE